MQEHIDSFHNESERGAAYPEQSIAHFEDVANITVDVSSVILQEKKMGVGKIFGKILTMKINLIEILRRTRAKQLNKM